jgi:hypothetical protein
VPDLIARLTSRALEEHRTVFIHMRRTVIGPDVNPMLTLESLVLVKTRSPSYLGDLDLTITGGAPTLEQ